MSQFRYFLMDVNRMLGRSKWRVIYIWLSRSFAGVLLYRFERGLFLIFRSAYPFIRIPLIPLFNLVQSYSNMDIHYKASIGGGLQVLHPSVGVVISGQLVAGEKLTLVGGNVIGIQAKHGSAEFRIGNDCHLGANATIVGPLVLGDKTVIGASACVTKSFENGNCTLVGVPARSI